MHVYKSINKRQNKYIKHITIIKIKQETYYTSMLNRGSEVETSQLFEFKPPSMPSLIILHNKLKY